MDEYEFIAALKRAGQNIFMFSSGSLRLRRLKAFVASMRRTASFSSKFALQIVNKIEVFLVAVTITDQQKIQVRFSRYSWNAINGFLN